MEDKRNPFFHLTILLMFLGCIILTIQVQEQNYLRWSGIIMGILIALSYLGRK